MKETITYIALTIFCLGLAVTGAAQEPDDMTIDAKRIHMMTDHLVEKASLEVPKEFEHHSAVALAMVSKEYFVNNYSRRKRTAFYRTLVKILDRAARDEFSTFDLSAYSPREKWKEDEEIYAFRLIKPSGEVVHVDPENLQQNADGHVAIPNLEVGDVLDFAGRVVETTTNYCFPPSILSQVDLPIVYGYRAFHIEHGFYFNFMALNGAPTLHLNDSLSYGSWWVYEMEYENQPGLTPEIFELPLRDRPSYKYQLCHTLDFPPRTMALMLRSPNEINSYVTEVERTRDLKLLAKRMLRHPYDRFTTTYTRDWAKTYSRRHKPTAEAYMQAAFNNYRYYTSVYNPYSRKFEPQEPSGFNTFLNAMITVAKAGKIPYEVAFTVSRTLGEFDEVLITGEVTPLFRFQNEDGGWTYIQYPETNETFGYLSPDIRGQAGVAINKKKVARRIVIPQSVSYENFLEHVVEITPKDDLRAELVTTTSAIGSPKQELLHMALDRVDTRKDAAMAFTRADRKEEREKLYATHVHNARKLGQEIVVDPLEKMYQMNEYRKAEYDVAEYTSFELLKSGMVSTHDTLRYRERFTLNGVMERVESHLLVNLGAVLKTDIPVFTDEEKAERRSDAYLPYPKVHRIEYRITIPEGYEARGLENFNHHVYNGYGSMSMESTVEGNEAVVRVELTYHTSFVPKEDWNLLVDILEPWESIGIERIVLSKIESEPSHSPFPTEAPKKAHAE